MQFFIDTANLDEITEAQALGVLDGVMVSHSLLAQENILESEAILNHYKEICNKIEQHIHVELISSDFEEMIKEGSTLANIDDKIVIKVPMTKDGVKAIRYFATQGIRTNCTLVFTTGQAILAAKAGAVYVSPFIGRMDDVAHQGFGLITQIAQVYKTFGFSTKVLATSVRHTMHLIRCAEEGADVATAPFQVIEGLFNHPMTDIGLARFLSDFEEVNEGKENQERSTTDHHQTDEKIAVVNS